MSRSTTWKRLRRRAAVLVDFAAEQIAGPADDADEVIDFLDQECQRVPVPGGPSRWTIADAVRTEVLTSAPRWALAQERRQLGDVADTQAQRALDRSLRRGWHPADLADLDVETAGNVAVVARWWAGGNNRVPAVADMTTHVERLRLFADTRSMAADHFVGRHDVLARLRQHSIERVQQAEQQPLLLWGVGGIGKSAVVANHVVWALDEQGAFVVLLDFDDATLNPAYLADIAQTVIERLARQSPADLARHLGSLREDSADEAYYGNYRSQSSLKGTQGVDAEWAHLLHRALESVPASILVVFDTVEQIQRRGPSAVRNVQTLLNELGVHERLSVVLSGRARVPFLEVTEYHLVGLDARDAVELLLDVSGHAVDPAQAGVLVQRFGTSALTVRLVATLLAKTEGAPGDLFDLRAANEQLDAELYLRILGHITDKAVRRLAHPGLVLRRITPDVIRLVLAGPCGIPVPDETHARSLLTRLAAEAMLVDSPEPDLLLHRPDVRAVMLPQLLRDPKVDVAAVQRAAVGYYAARTDLDSRVEELYHRLLLGQPPETLDERWDPRATDRLITAVDELPQASRVYLLRKMPDRFLGDSDRALVDDTQWVAEVEPEIRRLHSAGDAAAALMLLQERRAPDGSSLLPSLQLETLEALGRLDEAAEVARAEMRAASGRFDAPAVANFALHEARLLERSGSPEPARGVLQEALAAVEGVTVDRLRVLGAWLGLDRRHGTPDPAARRARIEETVALTRAIGYRAMADAPGLQRDIAAEVGDHAPDLLNATLTTVGLDALAGGSVPDELRALAASTDQPDAIVDLMQIPVPRRRGSTDPVEWREVVNQRRGVTGRGIVEVLTTFGDAAAGLRTAVLADYQRESDAALTGESLAQELHWSPAAQPPGGA